MADLSEIKNILKERGIKIKDFCKELNITEQGFAKIIRTNSTKIETLELIATKLDVPVSSFFSNATATAPDNYMDVPIVAAYAYAGYLRGFGDPDYVDSLPTMPVLIDRNYKGHYMIFEVKGDSMFNGSSASLMSGDMIMAREVRQEYWHSKLHYKNWYFIIVHRTEGILVKQIIDHDVENGIITCHSLNPLYENFTINLSDVAALYNVVSLVSREMRL